MSDYYEDDDDSEPDFLEWFIRHTYEEATQLHGNFQIVLEDEIIYGLSYTEALDRVKQLIAEAGFTVWECIEADGWTVEFFVEDDPENDLVLWATVESQKGE